MSLVTQFSDAYDRRARLYPMLVVLFPPLFAIGSALPLEVKLGPVAGSIVVTFALSALLTQLARDQGKRIEPNLYSEWNGRPSEHALSYGAQVTNRNTLKRVHTALRALDPDLGLPADAEAEAAAPHESHLAYRSATDLMIAKTRDKSAFPLLLEENINYGFRRNLLGMKPIGITLSVIGLLIGATRTWWTFHTDDAVDLYAIITMLFAVVLLAIWVLHIKSSWVKTAAEAYARQLVAAFDH